MRFDVVEVEIKTGIVRRLRVFDADEEQIALITAQKLNEKSKDVRCFVVAYKNS